MNIATSSHQHTAGLRLEALACDPPEVADAVWADVQIRCRTKSRALAGVAFRRCAFEHCYFGNATLDLSHTIFQHCILRDVTFMYGRLANSVFEDCELRDTYLRSADLRGAVFRRTLLRNVSFERADLHGCRFEQLTFQKMDRWGWPGYAGAILPDEQRFEYYETVDPVRRLRAALDAGELPAPREQVLALALAMEAAGVPEGPTMLRYQDWDKVLSLADFVALGRHLTDHAA